MRRFFGLALLATIALAPAAIELGAQQQAPGQERGARKQGHAPIARLLEQRAQLGLSSEQVSRLEGIQQQLQQQNAPLHEQLQAAGFDRQARQRGEAGQRREGARPERGARGRRQLPEELRPAMEQLRANSRAAMEQVQAVLTPEQRERARSLMQQRRSTERGRQGWRSTR